MKKFTIRMLSVIVTGMLFFAFTAQVYSQAALPVNRTSWGTSPTGWIDDSIGNLQSPAACTGNDAAIFDFGDTVIVNYNGAAATLSLSIRCSPANTGYVFNIEQSNNGVNYIPVVSYSPSGTAINTSCAPDNYAVNGASRYIRFVYATAGTATIDVDDVIIAAASTTTNWTGVGNWTNAANWSNGLPDATKDAVITGGVLTINGAGEADNFTINAGASVIISPNNSLTVNGTMTNSAGTAGLVIQSNATGTGSLIESTGSVPASVQLFLTGQSQATGYYHLVSSPIAGALADVFTNFYLYEYDQSQPAPSVWQSLVTGNSLSVMQGYAAFYPNDTTVEFVGTLNTGDQSMSGLTYPASQSWRGFYLMGNPYPSAINLESLNGLSTNIASSVHYWDQAANTGLGDYVSYVIGTGGTGSQYVPPMQGFFVRVSSQGLTGTFVIHDTARVHNTASYYKSGIALKEKFYMNLNSGSFNDDIMMCINADATDNYDPQFDAYKMFAENVPQVYTITPNNDFLEVNSIDDILSQKAIPIGLVTGTPTTYTFNFSQLENVNSVEGIYLEDIAEGKIINLRQNPGYTFTETTTEVNDRFVLHFLPVAPVGIEEDAAELANVYAYGNSVYVRSLTDDMQNVIIYNTLAQEVWSGNVGKDLQTVKLDQTGTYIVKVFNDNKVSTKKVFVK